MTKTALPNPTFFSHIHQNVFGTACDLFGVSAGWAAPVALFDAPAGFAEEVWINEGPDTVFAWILSGADVLCHWGPRRGTRFGRRHVTLQPRGTPNHFSAHENICFAQFVVPDALLARVSEELVATPITAASLRVDMVGFSDEIALASLNDYQMRARNVLEPPTRLEMEARALLIVERLITKHHSGHPRRTIGGLAPYLMTRVTEFIAARLADEISLDDMASIAGLSTFHFCRVFKQSTGIPPHRYQIALRIERAKDLLANSTLSIAAISAAVGYDDQGQLARLFRKEVGISPSHYRRERRL